MGNILNMYCDVSAGTLLLRYQGVATLYPPFLQKGINCVISGTRSWMAANFMMMNDDKIEFAIFVTQQQ